MDQHEIRNVNCVKCLIWNFDKSFKQAARKGYKNRVIKLHENTISLDKRGRKYCDAIVVSSHLDRWESEMLSFYRLKGDSTSKKELDHGCQIVFSKESDAYSQFIANFWPGADKLMIQPGNKD